MPVEPPPTRWRFPPVDVADEHGIVAVGGDLEPGTLLAAYRQGLFPMPRRAPTAPMAWWSPDPRACSRSTALRLSRSLRRSTPRYEMRVDTRLRRGRRRVRRPAAARRVDHRRDPRRVPPPARARLGAQRRGVGRRRRWPAASTAWPSAACSPASRCSTARTDASKVALAAPRRAARAPTATTAGCSTSSGPTPHLAVARRGRGAPGGVRRPGRHAAVELPRSQRPWPTRDVASRLRLSTDG